MKRSDVIIKYLKPGKVYRREDFRKWSNSLDRHLVELVKGKILKKLSRGVYYCIASKSAAKASPADGELVTTFLKEHKYQRYLLITPELYKTAGLRLPVRIHADRTVYNTKRHGERDIGGVLYHFVMKPFFPLEEDVDKAYLLVDAADRITKVKNRREVEKTVEQQVLKIIDRRPLNKAIQLYAGPTARNLFIRIFKAEKVAAENEKQRLKAG